MIQHTQKYKQSFIFRLGMFFIIFSFLLSLLAPSLGYAQTALTLPTPGTMVMPSAQFNPTVMLGMSLHPENPLEIDFIIDRGDDALEGDALKKESQKLMSYFFATMTVPEDQMWVNLSPYEENRIIADGLGDTVLGRDMLAQDYLLKQLSASIMYPEKELGKKFWSRVQQRVAKEYGSVEIPMNTFNKIWIMPDKASVYTHGTSVFVTENYLKVMLEEDYLALEHNSGSKSTGDPITGVTNEIVREILIPEIEYEVNYGKHFAPLRQMFHSMILATWYKTNLRSSILTQYIANQNKTDGVNTEDTQAIQEIYDQYVEAFQIGVYDYIKEEKDPVSQEMIPRKYFSGGVNARLTLEQKPPTAAWRKAHDDLAMVSTQVQMQDRAQLTPEREAELKQERQIFIENQQTFYEIVREKMRHNMADEEDTVADIHRIDLELNDKNIRERFEILNKYVYFKAALQTIRDAPRDEALNEYQILEAEMKELIEDFESEITRKVIAKTPVAQELLAELLELAELTLIGNSSPRSRGEIMDKFFESFKQMDQMISEALANLSSRSGSVKVDAVQESMAHPNEQIVLLVSMSDFNQAHPIIQGFLASDHPNVVVLRGVKRGRAVFTDMIYDKDNPVAIGYSREVLESVGFNVPPSGIINPLWEEMTDDQLEEHKQKIIALRESLNHPEEDILALRSAGNGKTVSFSTNAIPQAQEAQADFPHLDLYINDAKNTDRHVQMKVNLANQLQNNPLVMTDEVIVVDGGPNLNQARASILEKAGTVIALGDTSKEFGPILDALKNKRVDSLLRELANALSTGPQAYVSKLISMDPEDLEDINAYLSTQDFSQVLRVFQSNIIQVLREGQDLNPESMELPEQEKVDALVDYYGRKMKYSGDDFLRANRTKIIEIPETDLDAIALLSQEETWNGDAAMVFDADEEDQVPEVLDLTQYSVGRLISRKKELLDRLSDPNQQGDWDDEITRIDEMIAEKQRDLANNPYEYRILDREDGDPEELNFDTDDAAMTHGGVDFNANHLNLSISGKEFIQFDFPDIGIAPANVTGVLPVILNVTPIHNLPMLLGMTREDDFEEITKL